MSRVTDAAAFANAHLRLGLRGAELGSRVRLWGRARVVNHGRLVVRDRVRLVSTMARSEYVVGEEALLEIGAGSFVNYGASIAATERVVIGERCLIGTHAMLIDNDFHHLDVARRYEQPPSKPITLGDDVWLGGRVIVLPGVTIGDGSVVGAGSVVASDVPPMTVVGGVPAKPIREL